MEWLGLAVVLTVMVGAAVQVAAGTGFGLICAPFLILILGQAAGVQVVLLLSTGLNLIVLALTFREARWRDALLLFLPAAVIVIPTVFIADAVRGPGLTIAAGMVIVAATVLVARGRSLRVMNGAGGVAFVGAVSGVFTVIAAVAGPPVALLAAQRRWSPAETRATMQALYLPLNVVALIAFGPVRSDLEDMGWAVAGCVLGVAVGVLVARRLPAVLVRRMILLLAAAGGLWLIASGVWQSAVTAG